MSVSDIVIIYAIINVQQGEFMTDKNEYFKGTHDPNYGDKWTALLGNTNSILEDIAPKTLRESHCITIDEYDDTKYMIQIYTETSPICIVYISEMIEAEKRLSLVSAYPQLAGQKNRVQLKNTYAWDIKSEGEMAGKLIDVDNEMIINFHNTLFFNDINDFKEDDIKTVSLAGLAYNISKLEEHEFPIDNGNVYKHFLEEFLKENPDKTEADFESPVCQVSADSLRVFNPTDYTCEYSGVGQIKDIEYTTFFDTKVLIMNVEFANSDNQKPFCCNVYATESVLGDYMPTVGDGIVTTMWLTGYFEPSK